MAEEFNVFMDFLKRKNLKMTSQRNEILRVFLSSRKHLSVEELYDIVKHHNRSIGQATVFRTLKLLCEAGIAGKFDLGDRKVRYESKYGHQHHDHLICVECGKFIEVFDVEIEKLQKKLCRRLKFMPQSHRMEIFGICQECSNKEKHKK